MTKSIDHLMNRDPLELSAADIDEILAYNNRLLAAYEKGEAKEAAAKRKAALRGGVVVPMALWRK
jgi:hypothetical protein